ncbi:hypothetical protein [Clostridium sp. JN-9]|uniref:DUF7922 domain-containing protein n=1 Tax=Clostridium sp. JN-9 TaxID=2507159 RepID=UPI000FFE0300|nr:hypothetical protein [Clostridium sp. JN-9]QAT38891.1 hypothetical protein EQM05_00655 [Clostridium sp. JN-9]
MAQKKNYSRYFIILQEDEKGYATSTDKLPSGYLKLENKNDKCKVSYYVQNLKKEPVPYYMILICNKKEVKKIIRIGELNIDDYGRADVTYEYPIDSIGGSKISMDKISGAAIVKFLDSNIISVMSGFASTDIPQWKGFEMVDNSTRVKKEEKTADANNSIFDEYEKSIEKVKTVNKEDKSDVEQVNKIINEIKTNKDELKHDDLSKQERDNKDNNSEDKDLNLKAEKAEQIKTHRKDEKKVEIKAERKDEKKVETKAERNDEKKVEIEVEKEPKAEPEKENITYANDNIENRNTGEYPLGAANEFFRGISHGLEEVEELSRHIKKCTWYKVKVKSINDLYKCDDYNKYTVLYYPMLSYYPYIKQYGHYIIGYKFNNEGRMKYLVYGVPGRKSRREQPYGGKSGFVTWIPLDHGEEDEDSMGYWLMFYDFRNSTIIIPVK